MRTVAEAQLARTYDVTVLEIARGEERISTELRDVKIHAGDELLVRGSVQSIMEMAAAERLSIRSQKKYADRDLTTDEAVLAEAVISPSSALSGRTLKEAGFRHRYGVLALAIQKHGETIRDKIGNIRLDVGDALLVQGRREAVERLSNDRDFLFLQELEVSPVRQHRAPYALGIIALVVGLAALGIMPIVVSAILGCILMILCGCIRPREAYASVDWFVIFLLAGMIPLGIAMERTGTATVIAGGILGLVHDLGPVAVVSTFYLLTTLLASVISHNAAAILMVPIGIASAQELGVHPQPFLMAITFAASSALSTPFGYHTNLMVYSAGGYRFVDYLRVGVPLNLLLFAIASLLIPVFWPLG
jgi:di/tricarboxylate transporter